jgi:hypothetical protein
MTHIFELEFELKPHQDMRIVAKILKKRFTSWAKLKFFGHRLVNQGRPEFRMARDFGKFEVRGS